MRTLFICLAFCLSFSTLAKEWKSKRVYQNETNQTELLPSDWLKSDRLHNTDIWQNANSYNLIHNQPLEYLNIKQRRDFYKWLNNNLQQKGHEVLWVAMASYISHKLRLVRAFPYSVFTNETLKMYTELGSETVFNESFTLLKDIFLLKETLQKGEALQWDKKILYEEQYQWLANIYTQMDSRTIRKIDRMAKGKFLFGLVVPKRVRFTGDISVTEDRYNYAINVLRNYCESINE